jgi:hypothetical protein
MDFFLKKKSRYFFSEKKIDFFFSKKLTLNIHQNLCKVRMLLPPPLLKIFQDVTCHGPFYFGVDVLPGLARSEFAGDAWPDLVEVSVVLRSEGSRV